MRKTGFLFIWSITINLYRSSHTLDCLSKLLDCLLVDAALLGSDVLDALLTQLATLVLGAVWLRLLLVDVVVLFTACFEVVWCLVVIELSVVGDLLGRWLVVLICRDGLAVVNVTAWARHAA